MTHRRREFPRRVKLAAFERAGGRCEGCTARLMPGKFEYDHRIPCALGGEPTLANCVVRCTACHGVKTAHKDVPDIARAKRRQARHVGARTPPRHVIPGSKLSRWKKRLDGTVVER